MVVCPKLYFILKEREVNGQSDSEIIVNSKNHDRDCDWNHLGFLGARMDLHQRSW